MSTNYYDVPTALPIVVTWMILICVPFSIPPSLADSGAMGIPKTIVLDPGHGGTDLGVTGPDGLSEKTVVMNLSRLIASGPDENYRIVLTRTDDYQLDIQGRTSQANHCKADVFISLHTGGDSDAILIYHSMELPHASSGVSPWRQIQNRNLRPSVALAETIRKRIDQSGNHGKVEIRRAPILLLEGADMPAVLIETGHLPNSVTEMENNALFSDLANAIRSGIADFLLMTDGKERIFDLHDR